MEQEDKTTTFQDLEKRLNEIKKDEIFLGEIEHPIMLIVNAYKIINLNQSASGLYGVRLERKVLSEN
jgi:hypothetical protein